MPRHSPRCCPGLAFQCGSTTTAFFDPAAGNQRAYATSLTGCGVPTGESKVRISPLSLKLPGDWWAKNSSLFSRIDRLSALRYSCGEWPFGGWLAVDGQSRV